MQGIIPWFDRTFPDKPPIETFPFVIERLRGTPVRVRARTAALPRVQLQTRVNNAWSIQEHVGHLGDLESLWLGRIDDFMNSEAELRPADLTNRLTHDSHHNERSLDDLLATFEAARKGLVECLEAMSPDDAGRSSRHPRLQQPMRLIDLCLFVADHDDHHLAVVTKMINT